MYELRKNLSQNAILCFVAIDRMIQLKEKYLKDHKNEMSPYRVRMLEADIRRLLHIRKEIKDLEIFEGYVIEKGVTNE